MRAAALAASLLAVGLALAPATGAASQSRARSHASEACPAKSPYPAPLAGTRPGAARQLVPGRPNGVLLCRYSGLEAPDPQSFLLSRDVHSTPLVRRMTAEFRHLPKVRPPILCPIDAGTSVIALFEYDRGVDNPVTIGLSGCHTASNLKITRLLVGSKPGESLQRQIERLTGSATG